jgi:hypothetical protein
VAKAPGVGLGRVHRRGLAGVFGLLWVSGLLWLVYHYFLRAEGPFGPRPHPLEGWWLRLHGLAAFGALLAVGSLLPLHARGGWVLRKRLRSGLTTLGTFAWLGFTGYALYYFADPEERAWLPWLHWAAGLAVPVLLVAHVRRWRIPFADILGRRRRRIEIF